MSDAHLPANWNDLDAWEKVQYVFSHVPTSIALKAFGLRAEGDGGADAGASDATNAQFDYDNEERDHDGAGNMRDVERSRVGT